MGDVVDLGPTGEFPNGKLNADDQGGLNIVIAHDEKGTVSVNFGKEVAWFAFPQQEAIQFALTILAHAGATVSVNIVDSMVERAKEFMDRPLRDDLGERPAYIRALLTYAINGLET